jgi:hypothetical protein
MRLLRSIAKDQGRSVLIVSHDQQASAVVAFWDDETFVFCSRGCRDEFLAAPYRFFPDAAASGPHETAVREAVRHETALTGARK